MPTRLMKQREEKAALTVGEITFSNIILSFQPTTACKQTFSLSSERVSGNCEYAGSTHTCTYIFEKSVRKNIYA